MNKNLTWTIIKKEFARFFGDRSLVFTAVLMPGLLIYLVYSVMGSGLAKMEAGTDEPTIVYFENMPASVESLFDSLPIIRVDDGFDRDEVIAAISSKDENQLLVSFPADFDSLMLPANRDTASPAPNIRIYHNSVNTTAEANYDNIVALLEYFEAGMLDNYYDVNRLDFDGDAPTETFDQASDSDVLGSILGKLIPLLIVMLIFSGCMAVAPSAIAGEKERGTIATLLVTPMKRSQLALGKIISLSCFALLSGISSFLGIILSLPKLLQADAPDMPDITSMITYTTTDYLLILFLILATTLIMVSLVSILSAWAKDVKSAGTMVTPLMLVVMFCGLLPMLQGDTEVALGFYFLPFYNTIQCMASVFSFEQLQLLPMLITIGSNVIYTVIAVWALTKMFNSEKVMFGK